MKLWKFTRGTQCFDLIGPLCVVMRRCGRLESARRYGELVNLGVLKRIFFYILAPHNPSHPANSGSWNSNIHWLWIFRWMSRRLLHCRLLSLLVAQSPLFWFFVGICKIYEEHLRQLHPHSPSITYDISELFKFVDNLHDLSCLV